MATSKSRMEEMEKWFFEDHQEIFKRVEELKADIISLHANLDSMLGSKLSDFEALNERSSKEIQALTEELEVIQKSIRQYSNQQIQAELKDAKAEIHAIVALSSVKSVAKEIDDTIIPKISEPLATLSKEVDRLVGINRKLQSSFSKYILTASVLSILSLVIGILFGLWLG
jgi:DNA repair exonuclease SbcCD ATPase subunit